ncbi:MAG: ribosomal L7Ae/L30e/S12e/Gadd45 family protein [Lachnospiraceae bacterium]|nr:ribosomal L7Ae/L30e/S12e/Gadd45 family protein [Lachnospiraceae bacterium]
MLSLAAKAGKTVSGETAVLNAVRSGNASLVIISTDASDNTKKKFSDKCSYYGIPHYEYGTKTGIAHVIGKEVRSTVAVTDPNLGGRIRMKLEEMSVDGKDQDK